MKYESIKQSLHRVSSLLAECEQSGMSAIERDLILNELREIYTEVKFGGENREAVEKPSAEPLPAPVMEPDPTEEPETEPEIEVEIITCDDTDDAGEPEETETETETELETETAAETEPETVSSFFKSDEETQNRRRMMVRSLYDTTISAPAQPADTEEPQPQQETAAEPQPSEPSEPEQPAEQPEQTYVQEPAAAEPAEPVMPVADEHHFVADNTEHVLGEVINSDVQTFADTIAPAENAAADIVGKSAIDTLAEAIGINDRFLMIHDLFEGNADAFNAAIAKLDSFGNLNDCMVYIMENYEWNPYCEGAKLMMSLIERRYRS